MDGTLHLKDQLSQYSNRGYALESYSLLDFFFKTYEDNDQGGDNHKSKQVPYLPGTGNDKKCRVIRLNGHKALPRIVGPWFPYNNQPDE